MVALFMIAGVIDAMDVINHASAIHLIFIKN